MKSYLKNIKVFLLLSGMVVLMLLIANCAFNGLTVTVAPTGNPNEVSSFTLNSSISPRISPGPYTTKLIVGILAPKFWKLGQNSTLELKSAKGISALTLIPSSETEPVYKMSWSDAAKVKFKIGPNLLDDLEWVVFRSVQTYSVANNEDIPFNIEVKSKIGPQNVLVKLGFFIATSKESLTADNDYVKTAYSGVFSVSGGEGDLVDFVNPQLGSVDPVHSQDNDIVTLKFDAGVIITDLSNTEGIYLCAKAFTNTGDSILVCSPNDKTKLSAIGGKKFRIDLWPRGFFNVKDEQKLTRLEYYYTDVSGNIKVGYANTSEPFRFTFKCD